MTNFYNKNVLPKVVNWACKSKPTNHQRAKIIPLATDKVLEIGIGSGLNLPYYNNNVDSLTGIDPSIEIWELNKNKVEQLNFDFDFVKAFAEKLPFHDKTFNNVVITYSLCTIIDTQAALGEIKRVLKPNGKLLFCEHGLAPDDHIAYWQNKINPFWKKIGGGCHLNKNIPQLITDNGFKITQLDTMYIPGWKPANFNYWGVAEVR